VPMFDQSFCALTLGRLLRPSDYRKHPQLANLISRGLLLRSAQDVAHNLFSGRNPFTRLKLKRKEAYITTDIADSLVVRKISENLLHVAKVKHPNRNSIVENLKHFLMEGVPYQVFRLDLVSFYESFDTEDVVSRTQLAPRLSALSKSLLEILLKSYLALDGKGIPRGSAISAALCEMMMQEFDSSVQGIPGVYLYYRYVDDVVIITDDQKNYKSFLTEVEKLLPKGLRVNAQKKCVRKATALKNLDATEREQLRFEYLGYCFRVSDPTKAGKPQDQFRLVHIDIAESKIKKMKKRVIRSFYEYKKNGDYSLLALRLKFLTSNMRLRNFERNTTKLSGIYYNYPHVESNNSEKLLELDKFLTNSITGSKGRLFAATSKMLSRDNKAELSLFSFRRGHQTRCFYHFPTAQLRALMGCWSHE
jgi:Reverse transcriptase (RNA-dependent DNA polymerase)